MQIKMLQEFVDWLLYSLIGLDPISRISQSINFFVYDSIKILLLLFVMISVIGFLRTYLPQHKIKKWLSGKRMGIGNFFASVFGAITPFCSCSSIPIFLGFIKARIPLGVAFSFLITSPLINEYVVAIMFGFFGWKVTLAYVLSGLIIGTIGGIILGKMQLEKYIVKDILGKDISLKEVKYNKIKDRIMFGINESWSIVKKIWIWLFIAVGIGAIIHNYIPAEAIQNIITKAGIFSVPIATLLGVPMYASCAAILPVAIVLFEKGVPLGTALAFIMGTAGLSLPEAIILRRAMKLKLIGIFFLIVTTAIIFTGYLLNFLQPLLT